MCTVSWLYNEDGYQVFFNRDEQRSREKAQPPQIFSSTKINNATYIMPVDPQGLGSWMGVTHSGITVCLLNFYQGKPPTGPLISRGILVKQLLELNSFEKIRAALSEMVLLTYAPFSLLVFCPDKSKPYSLCWDGHNQYQSLNIVSPFTSSGVDFPIVSQHRQDSFKSLLTQNKQEITPELLFDFHRSHLPTKSMKSVCMHREDAKTVSLSHIKVEKNNINYTYWDGSPCSSQEKYSKTLSI
ncbi:NRDE family protein [Marinomonas sp. 15G1-11]|uniref:NRDE family protein n=1 Tax=Marinomonas phaeophyticola TaxID=3004091 RepID=A0ABT4JS13_9GAMM|nr:NRDE family protein [Marinomonas sp. 15G1-11]MCZ2721180.1 NRDE family protein [Marinomonas sp. 15G1-11]